MRGTPGGVAVPHRAAAGAAPPCTTMAALVSLAPGRDGWSDVEGWATSLEVLAPDRAAGQTWLDAHPGLLQVHLALAEARFAQMRPEGKVVTSVSADAGLRSRP